MRRTHPIAAILSLLLLTALLAEDDPLSKARAARDAARAEVEKRRTAMEKRYVEIRADFELTRSKDWGSLSAPLLPPIGFATSAVRQDPSGDPGADLEREFAKAGVLSETVSARAARAVAAGLVRAVKAGEEPDPAKVLAAALGEVFPSDDFSKCWDLAFQDLPEVLAWRKANEALAAAAEALARAEEAARAPRDAPEGMVRVRKGRFTFGPWRGWLSDLRENRAKKTSVRGFFIDVHEVTNAEYRDFLAGVKDAKQVAEWLPLGFQVGKDGEILGPEGQDDHPVRGLTFVAARAYARARGKRLPTEMEWERAARGEDGRLYPWGNEFDPQAANWKGRGFGTTTPVGKHPKDRSPCGAFDMAGNVSEMTSTLAGSGRKTAKERLDPMESVIFRGGSFREDRPENVALTYRWAILPLGQRREEVGFRCALSERDWKRK